MFFFHQGPRINIVGWNLKTCTKRRCQKRWGRIMPVVSNAWIQKSKEMDTKAKENG